MSLMSYPALARAIREKNRGRKNEVQVNPSPELWATFGGDNIQVWYEHNHRPVATLRPDNSLTINIHGWHTQTSVKIIEALSGARCYLSQNHVWVQGVPVDGPIEFDSNRYFQVPQKFKDIADKAHEQIATLSVDDLPAKHRMMLEVGTWNPSGAITQSVKDFCSGKVSKHSLSARDIMTIVSGCPTHQIIGRLFAEAV